MGHDARLIKRALIASFLLYVVLGLPDGIFGTVWPNLRDDFGRSDGGLGVLTVCTAVGYAVGSVTSGHLAERLGIHRLLPVCIAFAGLFLGVLAVAPSWWVAMTSYVLLGVAWGAGDAGLNAWMALTQGPRQMGLLHASYGIGAVLGPLLATALMTDGSSWRAPYALCAVLTAGAAATLVWSRHGFDAAPRSPDVAASNGAAAGSNRVLTLLVLWFAAYVGLEVAISSWSFTFLSEGRGMTDVAAGIITALFWGGLTVGRFALAAVGHRLDPERIVRASTVVAFGAALVLWVDPFGAGWLSLPVMGLGLSMMFPVVMGRSAVYLGAERATKAVGYQIGASAVGFSILPALIGVIAERHGIEWAAPVIVVTIIITGLIWLAIERATTTMTSELTPSGS